MAFFLAAGAAALAILFIMPVREQVREPKRPSLKRVGALITRKDDLGADPGMAEVNAAFGF